MATCLAQGALGEACDAPFHVAVPADAPALPWWPFVKALSKIRRAGQAPSVTIPRTSHRFGPLAYLRDVRNCVFRQL